MTNNAASDYSSSKATQIARAEYLDTCLREERWTLRTLQARTGISKSVIYSRLNGETPLTFGDIEVFADALKRDPVELFSTLLEIPSKKAPGRGGPGALLPDLDSNQEPAVYWLDDFRKPFETLPEHEGLAPVTSIVRPTIKAS